MYLILNRILSLLMCIRDRSIDSRLATIETAIGSLKTTIKASAVVITVVFSFCAYIFGNYVAKILDALNGLVLK